MSKLLLFLLTLTTFLSVNAQTNTGNIEGVITTPEGNPVPNVNVTIKGKKKHAVTNEKGHFEFNEIPYGEYILVYSFEGETSQEVPVTVPPVSSEASKYNLSLNARELKEVIVRIGGSINQGTARIGKSNIPIMDLPQAVTIIGQATIENQQAQRLSDVVKNVNGVYLGGARASTQETFYARGYNLGNTNTFKNGFRVNSGAMPEMSAIESVEVLKGGAALLYGNVAPGGIINMITKKPRFNFGGEINMRVGSYDLYKPSVDIYGPISQSVAYRLNGTYEKANSYRNEVHSERFYVNPSLLFKLSEKTKLLVQGDYLQHKFTPDFGIGTMSDKAGVYGGKTVTPVGRNAFFGAPWQYAQTNQATASAELNHTFNDNWQLSALAGYQNYERDYFSLERIQADVNGKWRRPLGKTNNKQDYYTGQVNLNGQFQTGTIGHKVLIGMDGERDLTTNLASTYSASTFYDSINLVDPAAYTPRTDMPADWKWKTSADAFVTRFGAYVQDFVTLSDKFKLLAGIRWSFQQTDPTQTTYLQNDSAAYGNIQIDKAFSPRIGLVYQPTNHTTVFSSYSNSFSPNSGRDINNQPLKPSFIDQFELGVKNDFLDGLLSANLTLYRIINSNLSQPALENPEYRELTGQTTSDGIEVDLKSQPVKGWDILAGYSYNNMRYTKTSGRKGSFVEGPRLVNSPAHTANATTFYTFQDGAVRGLKFGGGIYYVGERNAGWNNDYSDDNGTIRDRMFKVDGFVTVDVSAGYTYKKWSLLAKLANITNTFNYYVHENYSINPIPPRNFVVTAAFKF
ncbi:TonB-dependent siderophore receptor [Niabella hirudinis]|uniref:TonB-dependent siderophore receptor n=1 Tax=Niabella hirudinis TaxID=1285929 RepID=UPI003EB7E21C